MLKNKFSMSRESVIIMLVLIYIIIGFVCILSTGYDPFDKVVIKYHTQIIVSFVLLLIMIPATLKFLPGFIFIIMFGGLLHGSIDRYNADVKIAKQKMNIVSSDN